MSRGMPLLPRTMWTTYHHEGQRFLCIWRQWLWWSWDETHVWLSQPTAANREEM